MQSTGQLSIQSEYQCKDRFDQRCGIERVEFTLTVAVKSEESLKLSRKETIASKSFSRDPFRFRAAFDWQSKRTTCSAYDSARISSVAVCKATVLRVSPFFAFSRATVRHDAPF